MENTQSLLQRKTSDVVQGTECPFFSKSHTKLINTFYRQTAVSNVIGDGTYSCHSSFKETTNLVL